MRILLIILSISVFSCSNSKNNKIVNSTVQPRIDISSDTISNGGLVQCKLYLTFDPQLSSTEINELISGVEVSFDSTQAFTPTGTSNLTSVNNTSDTTNISFLVEVSDTSNLEFIEQPWHVSVRVSYKTNQPQQVDTTFVDSFKTIVHKEKDI